MEENDEKKMRFELNFSPDGTTVTISFIANYKLDDREVITGLEVLLHDLIMAQRQSLVRGEYLH